MTDLSTHPTQIASAWLADFTTSLERNDVNSVNSPFSYIVRAYNRWQLSAFEPIWNSRILTPLISASTHNKIDRWSGTSFSRSKHGRVGWPSSSRLSLADKSGLVFTERGESRAS